MKINTFLRGMVPAVLLSLAFAACNKETKSEPSTVGVVPPTSNPAFMNVDAQQAQAAPAANGTPVNVTPIANAQPQTAPAPTAPGMNPPHGQPGHRCEIAVGAPLSSAPAAKQQPAAQTTVTPQPAPAEFAPPAAKQTADVVTPPGMNPPHGQPGHTCSVAVGAPLPK